MLQHALITDNFNPEPQHKQILIDAAHFDDVFPRNGHGVGLVDIAMNGALSIEHFALIFFDDLSVSNSAHNSGDYLLRGSVFGDITLRRLGTPHPKDDQDQDITFIVLGI